jgi:hypothetical protein
MVMFVQKNLNMLIPRPGCIGLNWTSSVLLKLVRLSINLIKAADRFSATNRSSCCQCSTVRLKFPQAWTKKTTNTERKSYTRFSWNSRLPVFASLSLRISPLLLVIFLKAHRLRCHALDMVVSQCSFASILNPSKRLQSQGRFVSRGH